MTLVVRFCGVRETFVCLFVCWRVQLGRESCNTVDEVSELSAALGNVTIVRKGPHDVIASAEKCESQLACFVCIFVLAR